MKMVRKGKRPLLFFLRNSLTAIGVVSLVSFCGCMGMESLADEMNIASRTETEFTVTPSLNGEIAPEYQAMGINQLRAAFGAAGFQNSPTVLWDYSYLSKEVLQSTNGVMTSEAETKLASYQESLSRWTLFTVKLQSTERRQAEPEQYRFLLQDDQGREYPVTYLEQTGIQALATPQGDIYYNFLTIGFDYQITRNSQYIVLYRWEGQLLKRTLTWRFIF